MGGDPHALATGLEVNAFVAVTIATTPGLTWPDVMGLVAWVGTIMSLLALTGCQDRLCRLRRGDPRFPDIRGDAPHLLHRRRHGVGVIEQAVGA